MKRHFIFLSATLLMFLIFSVQPVFSQSSKEMELLKEEMKALNEGQREIRNELREIKALLMGSRPRREEGPEFKEATVRIENNPFKGHRNARIAVIEFSDYECPYCAEFASETLKELESAYIETGKVKYIFINYPLDSHEHAFKAAEAAHCANEQGKFWQMHDRLMENQRSLTLKDLLKYGEEIGLEPLEFENCLVTGKFKEAVSKDLAKGRAVGIEGTPTFLVGWVEEDGKEVRAIRMIKGSQPFGAFARVIDDLLLSQ